MQQSFSYFPNKPLKSEKEIEDYMKDLGLSHYGRYIEIAIDLENLNIEALNTNHPLYDRIMKALKDEPEDGFASFRI